LPITKTVLRLQSPHSCKPKKTKAKKKHSARLRDGCNGVHYCHIAVPGIGALQQRGARERGIEVRSAATGTVICAITTTAPRIAATTATALPAAATTTTEAAIGELASITTALSGRESEGAKAAIARTPLTRRYARSEAIATIASPTAAAAAVILATITSTATATGACGTSCAAPRAETGLA
jgi:hypothetical protein